MYVPNPYIDKQNVFKLSNNFKTSLPDHVKLSNLGGSNGHNKKNAYDPKTLTPVLRIRTSKLVLKMWQITHGVLDFFTT